MNCCRYVSVHHPIDYNMSMNDPREIQKRLFKYFAPVLLLSVAFNIPKVSSFFTAPENLTLFNMKWWNKFFVWKDEPYLFKGTQRTKETSILVSVSGSSSHNVYTGWQKHWYRPCQSVRTKPTLSHCSGSKNCIIKFRHVWLRFWLAETAEPKVLHPWSYLSCSKRSLNFQPELNRMNRFNLLVC